MIREWTPRPATAREQRLETAVVLAVLLAAVVALLLAAAHGLDEQCRRLATQPYAHQLHCPRVDDAPRTAAAGWVRGGALAAAPTSAPAGAPAPPVLDPEVTPPPAQAGPGPAAAHHAACQRTSRTTSRCPA